jgi:hypothetical protein
MHDRREHPRADVGTSAVVLARHNGGVVVSIESLSISGARLAGQLTVDTGEIVQILFEVDGHPIEVDGEVLRVESRDLYRDQISVRFGELTTATRTLITQLVRKTLDRQHANTLSRARERLA